MLMKRPHGAGRASGGRGHGLLDAPWWLLWAVIAAAALVLAIKLGILG